MHTHSGLLERARRAASTWPTAEEPVLDYVREFVPEPASAPAGRQHGRRPTGCSSARDMPDLESYLHYRIVDVSSIKELARRWYPRAYFASAGQARQPPRARRHPGEHRGAALLPRGDLRALPRPGLATRPARSPPSTAARSPLTADRARPTTAEPADLRDAGGAVTLSGPLGAGRRRAAMVGVAQLVEHLVVVQVAAGSSPVTHPTENAPARPSRGLLAARDPRARRSLTKVRGCPCTGPPRCAASTAPTPSASERSRSPSWAPGARWASRGCSSRSARTAPASASCGSGSASTAAT